MSILMSRGLDISHFEPGHVPVKDCLGQLSGTTGSVMVSPQPHTRARRPPAWEYSDIKCREEISYLHKYICMCA